MAGIDRDGGGIDMYPAQARTAIAALQKVATDIRATFEQRLREVTGLDSQLGNGQAGAAFYLKYQPFVDQVIPQLRELITSTEGHGANGISCVSQYVRQDMENRGVIQSVEPRD